MNLKEQNYQRVKFLMFKVVSFSVNASSIEHTVKPVYNALGCNESYRFHRSHRFLYQL
jgi:hypothetical protein